jgi:hypothetical protein
MTRRKETAMTLRTLTRMRNSLWGLHHRGKVGEGKEGNRSRVRVYPITRLNSLRKSTSRVEKRN